jgi:hypothetical protein
MVAAALEGLEYFIEIGLGYAGAAVGNLELGYLPPVPGGEAHRSLLRVFDCIG